MKGLILAPRYGAPWTSLAHAVCPHLLPVYDKPAICYSIATLMQGHIRDMILVCTPQDTSPLQSFLGTGEHWGLQLVYRELNDPGDVISALRLATPLLGNNGVAVIQADHLFVGLDFNLLLQTQPHQHGARAFSLSGSTPDLSTPLTQNEGQRAFRLDKESSASDPDASWSILGFGLFDSQVVDIAASQGNPTARGQSQWMPLYESYRKQHLLDVTFISKATHHLLSSTCDAWLEASQHVKFLQARSRDVYGCLDATSRDMGFIDDKQFASLAERKRTKASASALPPIPNPFLPGYA